MSPDATLIRLGGLQELLRHLERHRVYSTPTGMTWQLRREEARLWLEWSQAAYALEASL